MLPSGSVRLAVDRDSNTRLSPRQRDHSSLFLVHDCDLYVHGVAAVAHAVGGYHRYFIYVVRVGVPGLLKVRLRLERREYRLNAEVHSLGC